MAAAELRHRFHRFRLPPRVRAAQAGSRNGGPACMDRMCGAETYADHCMWLCQERGGNLTERVVTELLKSGACCTWVSTWPVLPVNVEDPASLRTLRPTSRTGAPRLGIGRNPLAQRQSFRPCVTTPTVNLNIDVCIHCVPAQDCGV